MTWPEERFSDPMSSPQALTLAELAERAGVSTATVSKVINGRTEVAPETRALVEGLIREHGYRRQRQRVRPARLIEVVFHELAGDYPVEIIKGVQQVARRNHAAVVISDFQGDHTPGRTWIEEVMSRRSTGVITVFSSLTSSQRDQLATRNIPLVMLDPLDLPMSGVPSVSAANWSGGLVATRHLLELGHRRIAVITGPPNAVSSRARVDGYRAALEMAGLSVDPDLVRTGDYHIVSGLKRTKELMGLPDPPTAIFTSNDGQAVGAYWAAAELKLRIPDDLSVIGFDDMPSVRWTLPPLTTVRQPLTEMGNAAATMLLALADGRQPAQTRVEVGTELVVRGSTAPIGNRPA
ncbi:LacI family DNA-binding transcriptional regulator [Streptosporangium longisporum]|uniref:LacI family DNA-binding transcriptional regulator n=1 Tax=Streptosporangium longisporum TaxID=46187 RepID=A0ABN3XYX1_9ACTN